MLISSNSPVLSPTLKLFFLSSVLNAVLIFATVWVTSAALSLVVLVPLFLLISGVEMFVWHSASTRRHHVPHEPQVAAVRRLDIRRRSGIIDESTGLYARWYFDRRIEEEAARCKRYNHSMAVVVLRVGAIDLTTFSLDGWQKRSLEAAQRAAKVVREVDISAALSPFEFAICLVHCDRGGAYRALQRLTDQMADYNCEAGVAVFPDEHHQPSTLVDLASARIRGMSVVANSA